MARGECTEASGSPDRWQTLFNDDTITYKIVYSTFLISVTCGGLHLVSCIMSLYLGVLFRKISQLPPDMNPLEDNLTSRHKRNKSSILDNRMSQASAAKANGTFGEKVDDPLMTPVRTVPFMHTRNDSQSSPSNVSQSKLSSRASKSDDAPPFYDQPPSSRNSRIEEPSIQSHSPTRLSSHFTSRTPFPNLSLQSQQPTVPDLIPHSEPPPKSPLRQQTTQQRSHGISRSPTKSSSIYSTDTTTATSTTLNARPPSVVPSLLDSNWITHPSPSPSPSPPHELKHLAQKPSYQPLLRTSPFEYTTNIENRPPPILGNPLEMNPPTPPMEQRKQRIAESGQRALNPVSGNGKQQGNWFQGPGTIGIGKARAWGGMDKPAGRPNGAGRVVSRSGVEVRGGGILPSGGVRAREVSGKMMEEGRGKSNWDLIRE